jgi:succinyl-CoA synthetase beta subunit
LVGGRGKAGGVKVVSNEADLATEFTRIKNLTIKGYAVEQLLVARGIDIKKEYYVAVTIDNVKAYIKKLKSLNPDIIVPARWTDDGATARRNRYAL